MKVIGLLYPANSPLPARRAELIESGRVFYNWLVAKTKLLDWVVYDYQDNGYLHPEADVDALVVFGRPKARGIRNPRTFKVASYDSNADLLIDLAKKLELREETYASKNTWTGHV